MFSVRNNKNTHCIMSKMWPFQVKYSLKVILLSQKNLVHKYQLQSHNYET